MAKEKILVTIAARGGSKGVKDKNIRPLCGVPLIAHTIRQARRWGRADRIVCTTDSAKIAATAVAYGAEAPFRRPRRLSGDRVGKIPVLRHALEAMERLDGVRYPVIVDLDVTAPIRKIADIEGAYRLFLGRRPKSVFSAVPARKSPYFNMVETSRAGYARLVKKPGAAIMRRQDAPAVYDLNASIYIYDRRYLLDRHTATPISDRSLVWVMDGMSAFDIDHETDLQFVEFLVAKGLAAL